VIFENTVAVEPSKSPEDGYHFMTDMTDKAVNWLRYSKAVAPRKPLFLYCAGCRTCSPPCAQGMAR